MHNAKGGTESTESTAPCSKGQTSSRHAFQMLPAQHNESDGGAWTWASGHLKDFVRDFHAIIKSPGKKQNFQQQVCDRCEHLCACPVEAVSIK